MPKRLSQGAQGERDVAFATAAQVIGKHQWRCVVYQHHSYGLVTQYQWRRAETDPWRADHEWLSYNDNDGAYAGCPRTLGKRVFYPNEREIRAALGKGEPQNHEQMAFVF